LAGYVEKRLSGARPGGWVENLDPAGALDYEDPSAIVGHRRDEQRLSEERADAGHTEGIGADVGHGDCERQRPGRLAVRDGDVT